MSDDIEASNQLHAGAPAGVRVGWISTARLARECMTDGIARAQPLLRIEPFETARDCVEFSGELLDLVVYHSRGFGVTDLRELGELRKAFASGKILVLSDVATVDPSIVRKVLAEGASGFILTNSNSLQMLASAIRLVSAGGIVVSKEYFVDGLLSTQPSAQANGCGSHQMTQRERSVLALMKHGKPNKIIASELGMSLCTVKVHARNLMRKMGAANRTQAAINADRIL